MIPVWVVCMFSLASFFFFKQKTAYEMRISDWSSDVCSSDLRLRTAVAGLIERRGIELLDRNPILRQQRDLLLPFRRHVDAEGDEIGRASCRERVCQYV